MAARSFIFLVLSFCCKFYFVESFDCKNGGQKLQVHLVPHTHDDVGWLKTVDEYFYGANRSIQAAGVQYILDTVVTELQKNPSRTFIYVEIAFFERWWKQQSSSMQQIVKNLVNKKQLEFINGGWCMNDEASTHYNAIIDQMTLGLKFIDETFGQSARPTVAWHIDPFGHSAEQASLFSLMSFDGFFFGRIDEQDKQKRLKEQRMEMVWRGSRNYQAASQIFTGVLYNGYGPPAGFCFDDYCGDEPIQDDPNLYDMNVKERVEAFVNETCEQAKSYKTNNIILTMGSDFQYSNALRWYKNLDKLIKYVNQDGRVNVFYSTPSRYLKALHDAAQKWELKTDDFFPYAHCDHCYWTGYFTSRPALKGYVRETNNLLQACKQIETIRGPMPGAPTSDLLKKAMGVAQHHDAVSGTEKQHVANDYAKRLYIGREQCKSLMEPVIEKKISKGNPSTLKFIYCDFLNISTCALTVTETSFAINIYNTIGRSRSSFVRIPVNSQKYTVTDPSGKNVIVQIVDVTPETAKLQPTSGGAKFELVFQIIAPAMGYSTYLVQKVARGSKFDRKNSIYTKASKLTQNNNVVENSKLKLEFSTDTGRLVSITRKDLNLTVDVDQQFFWYNGSTGNKESKQTSGAYIFRPNNTSPYCFTDKNKALTTIVKGAIVQEIRQTFGCCISQVIRLYGNVSYAEFEHTIGPIPIPDNLGKEVITRFDTKIASGAKFYTDANGREMKERTRNHRDTWPLNVSEPVSGNYYPVNSRIYIKDGNAQLTVMSDRSQGGSSINDGQIEIMVHRRLLVDDFLGVGEALNETGVEGQGLVTRGKHRVLLSKPNDIEHRVQGEDMMMTPILSFSKNTYTPAQWKESFRATYSGLTKELPDNVHLLTVELWTSSKVLLRLENFYEANENPKIASIELDGLFADFGVLAVDEYNLAANQPIESKKMLPWNITSSTAYEIDQKYKTKLPRRSNIAVQIKPMEIKTYIVDVEMTSDFEMRFRQILEQGNTPVVL